MVEISRPDGSYVCFNQLKSLHFQSLPRGTLSAWIHRLEITKLKCTEKEQAILKLIVPQQKGKPFYLLKPDHAQQLLAKNRERYFDLNARAKAMLPQLRQNSQESAVSQAPFPLIAPRPSQFSVACGPSGNPMAAPPITSTVSSDWTSTSKSSCWLQAEPKRTNSTRTVFPETSTERSPCRLNPGPTPSECATTVFAGPSTATSPWRLNLGQTLNTDVFPETSTERSPCRMNPGPTPSDCATTVLDGPSTATSHWRLNSRQTLNTDVFPETSTERSSSWSKTEPSKPSVLVEPPQLSSSHNSSEQRIESDSEEEDNANGADLRKSRNVITLADADMTPALKRDFIELCAFYGAAVESRRRGTSLAQPTMQKMTVCLKMFFHFVKYMRALEPDFCHLEDASLLEAYAKHLGEGRRLKNVTISRNMHALEKGLLFRLRDDTSEVQIRSKAMVALKNIRYQCERAARVDAMRVKEGVGCKPKHALVYAEILQLCKEHKASFEEESNPIGKARRLHDLTLLLMYLHFVPRAHEVRTLVLERDFPAGEIVQIAAQRENVLVLYDDGAIELLLTKYKTDKVYGPTKIPVPYDSPIAYYLREYVCKFRDRLLMGAGHAYVFVNARGQEFSSSSAFSKYLSQIIENGTGKKGSTNSLRHAIATKFVSDPEFCADEAFRESLSRVMRHSRSTQEKCYVDLTNAAKSEQALEVLSRAAASEIFDDCMIVNVKNRADFSDSDEECMAPSVGDLVALVDPQSTAELPIVFIAKILRLRTTRNEAVLAEFEEFEEDLYRLKIQTYRPWVESLDSLIWPIDIAYHSESKAYKLRTPKAEIYASVAPAKKKPRRLPSEQ